MPPVPQNHATTGLTYFVWAVCGSTVVMYVLLSAVGAFEPSQIVELTIVVVAIAALLLAHEWRGMVRRRAALGGRVGRRAAR
jgi:hypothetical protein